MAYTFKSRRNAYDNIANGSATGVERHVVGGGPQDLTSRESQETLGVSANLTNSSNLANTFVELKVGWTGNNVSDANVHGGVSSVDADQTPTSGTSPGHTSGSSWTSAIVELLG